MFLRLAIVLLLISSPWVVESFLIVRPLVLAGDHRGIISKASTPKKTTRKQPYDNCCFIITPSRVVGYGRSTTSGHSDTTNRMITMLHMSWFDKAFHGGGSANQDELDEIWNTQQAILAARRNGGETKEHLKAKYKEPRKYFQVKATTTTDASTSSSNSRRHLDDVMYVQEDRSTKRKKNPSAASTKGSGGGGGVFKMPWDKN